jgi:DNA-binding NarL/FixJ family response regulator
MLFPELSDREHEVLEHLARGLGNHEIAAHLFLPRRPCATTWPRSL